MTAVGTGEEGVLDVADSSPDLVLLDLGLPDMDGTEVVRRVRAFSDVPVIILSVRESPHDKVAALDAGADDFVTKPFAMEELLARARAALRRRGTEESAVPELVVRRAPGGSGQTARDASRRGRPPDADGVRAPRGSRVEPGKLLTHQWLLRKVWGQGYGSETTYLRTYVRALRKKLGDDAAAPVLILTEPGVGYRWVAEPST